MFCQVSAMEMDLLVGENMTDALEKSQPQVESAIREIELSTLMASSKSRSATFEWQDNS